MSARGSRFDAAAHAHAGTWPDRRQQLASRLDILKARTGKTSQARGAPLPALFSSAQERHDDSRMQPRLLQPGHICFAPAQA